MIFAYLLFMDSLISKSSFLDSFAVFFFDCRAFFPVLELRDEFDCARFLIDDFADETRSILLTLFFAGLNGGKTISLVA